MNDAPRFELKDLAAIVTLTLLAALLRGKDIGAQGLTHFDEGAYAMTAQALASGRFTEDRFQVQHYLSPPVYFGVAAAAMRVFDLASDQALIGTAFGFALATIALVYLMGLVAYGRPTAVTAALLLSSSGLATALARIGLTDSAFAFFFLLALLLFATAETRRSIGFAALAGLAMGLAWNTKYHGWLAGCIAAAAFAPRLLDPKARGGVFLRLTVAASVAVACYLPWYGYVASQPGGYAALAAQHANFLRPANYLRHALIQADSQVYLDSMPARLSLAAAIALAAVFAGRRTPVRLLVWIAAAASAGWAVGQFAVVLTAALFGFATAWRKSGAAARIVVAHTAVFALLTPAYNPYARLMLPLILGLVLLAGVAVQLACETARDARFSRLSVVALLVAALGFALIPREDFATAEVDESVPGFRAAAAALARVRTDLDVVVVGEPACVAYLRANGRRAFHVDRRAEIYERWQRDVSLLVVIGRYARLTDQPPGEATGDFGRWTSLDSHHVRVGPLRLLDDMRPYQARRHPESSEMHDLTAYLLEL